MLGGYPLRIPLIFNPKAGRGHAAQRLRQLLGGYEAAFQTYPTNRPGEATRIAQDLATTGTPLIAAAGGDGTVHEVAEGILRSTCESTALHVIPIGSANDYYHSVRDEIGSAGLVDVGAVEDRAGRSAYFLCCMGLGFNAAVTEESRRIRFLRGIPLYGLATLRAMWRKFRRIPTTITTDSETWRDETLMLSVLIGKREGAFTLAPSASLCDGVFDFIHAASLSRWQVAMLLPYIAIRGAPDRFPGVKRGTCRSMRIESDADLAIHIDGEFFCVPRDRIRQISIRLLPRRLRVVTDIATALELVGLPFKTRSLQARRSRR